jgi:hypothetical protein
MKTPEELQEFREIMLAFCQVLQDVSTAMKNLIGEELDGEDPVGQG